MSGMPWLSSDRAPEPPLRLRRVLIEVRGRGPERTPSAALQELLDFEGHEIYFHKEPELVGHPYRDSLFAFEECAAMGIFRSNGECVLNPRSSPKTTCS